MLPEQLAGTDEEADAVGRVTVLRSNQLSHEDWDFLISRFECFVYIREVESGMGFWEFQFSSMVWFIPLFNNQEKSEKGLVA